MQNQYGDRWRTTETPLWQFITRHLSILMFLAIAAAGMFAVYLYFTPADGIAEVVAASEGASQYSAPFAKPIPSKPVIQRISQSPGPLRVGIISGHRGNDSGAVCADGLTEAQVNEDIAGRVVAAIQAQGIATDLLDEFDPRLKGYVATVLVSIHADSCDYINELATGFKMAGSSYTDSTQLSICVEHAYRQATQLNYHANTITPHMTDYHAFREIAVGVPAIIIETGFMNLDREFLTTRQNDAAGAIAEGILCYIEDLRGGRPVAGLTGNGN